MLSSQSAADSTGKIWRKHKQHYTIILRDWVRLVLFEVTPASHWELKDTSNHMCGWMLLTSLWSQPFNSHSGSVMDCYVTDWLFSQKMQKLQSGRKTILKDDFHILLQINLRKLWKVFIYRSSDWISQDLRYLQLQVFGLFLHQPCTPQDWHFPSILPSR